MRRYTLVETDWSEASFKERWLCTMFNMILGTASHDETMTVLLSLLASITYEDEIDIIIDQFNQMKKH
jgi:hypothetical protein